MATVVLDEGAPSPPFLPFDLCPLPFDLFFGISKFKWQNSNGKCFAG
jgi:hypothetical protein